MIDVGKMILTLRKERGMTQSDLAKRLNCTKQSISFYERGKRSPDYLTLEALADIFNVPMAMLISPDDQKRELEKIYATYGIDWSGDSSALSADEKELLRTFRSFNAAGQKYVMDTVRGMAYNPNYQKQDMSSEMA